MIDNETQLHQVSAILVARGYCQLWKLKNFNELFGPEKYLGVIWSSQIAQPFYMQSLCEPLTPKWLPNISLGPNYLLKSSSVSSDEPYGLL